MNTSKLTEPEPRDYLQTQFLCLKYLTSFQAVMRHYIGKKHGVLDRFVKEELAQIRKENGGQIPGAVITPTIEGQL